MVFELFLLGLTLMLLFLYLRRSSLSALVSRLPPSFSPSNVPLKPFANQFTTVDSPGQLITLVSELRDTACLGVDIEQFQQKGAPSGVVCLIQISDGTKTYLVDTLKLGKSTRSLRALLENPAILKVMHGCHSDIRWLQRDFAMHIVNLYDTQAAARLLGLEGLSLNELWGKYCGYGMAKEEKRRMQLADWSLRPLTEEMASYAALDAFYLPFLQSVTCSALSAQQLLELRTQCNALSLEQFTSLPSSHRSKATDKLYRELCALREQLSTGVSPNSVLPTSVLSKIAEIKPETESELLALIGDWPIRAHTQEILAFTAKAVSKANRLSKKQARFEKFRDKYTVKKNIYENCQMQAPDGEVLCYCDKKKTQWYLERQLADVISDDPVVIRLRFEPNGRGFSDVYADPEFYMKFKENQCVVCGVKKNFLRYHVVPVLYRQHFPERLKSHRSHDVVILCPKCHELANKHSDLLKKEIAEEYGVPLNEFGDLYYQREDVIRIGKLCLSLAKHRKNMPNDRRDMMEGQVRSFFEENIQYREFLRTEKGIDCEEMSEELLRYMAKDGVELLKVYGDVNWKKIAVNRHGLEVLQKIPDLKDFIKRWRLHFLQTMSPQYLPDAWSVDHALNLLIT